FTAKMAFQNIETQYYHGQSNSVEYSYSIVPSFNGCPGCKGICKPCYKCLVSNPGTCSLICEACWSCDCTAPSSPVAQRIRDPIIHG
ncbi:MAG: hypothetical protein WAZ77_15180, partial [Candidatus Nitrosopolaris sp.]